MKLPSPETQERWLERHVAPIATAGNFGEAITNFKEDRRESLRDKMQEAGVMDSLQELDERGTSFERLMSDVRGKIFRADRRNYRPLDLPLEPHIMYFGNKPGTSNYNILVA